MQKPNNRLTYITPWRYEEGGPDETPGGIYGYSTNCSPKALIERLGEYEDTGLTPDEINDLAEICRKLLTMHAVSVGGHEFYVNHFSVGDLNELLRRIATLLTEGDIHG